MAGPELYPDYEEALQAVLESPKMESAIDQFCRVVDTGYSDHMIEEAGKTLAAQIHLLFSRERDRAKEIEDDTYDEHADFLGAS